MKFYDSKKLIEEWLKIHRISDYIIRNNNTVDVNRSIYLYNSNITEIPIKFNTIDGSIDLSHNLLVNLDFMPKEITGYIDIRDNEPLTNLNSLPKKITHLLISSCTLKDFTELPKEINKLTIKLNKHIPLFDGIPENIKNGIELQYNYKKLYPEVLDTIIQYFRKNGLEKGIKLLLNIKQKSDEENYKELFEDILIPYLINDEINSKILFTKYNIWNILNYNKTNYKSNHSSSDTFFTINQNRRNATIENINNYINNKVKGQKEAIKVLSYSIFKFLNKKNNQYGEHVLLIGNSGTGKTEMVNTFERYANENQLNLRIVKKNITNISTTGYKGEDINDILPNISRNEKAIIYLDEFDKLFGIHAPDLRSTSTQVLFNIMTFLEDPRYLFIFSGVFKDIDKEGKLNKQKLGFIKQKDTKKKKSVIELTNNIMKYADENPEFLGRIPHIIKLNDINEDTIKEIINDKIEEFTKNLNNTVKIDSKLKNIILDIYKTDESAKLYGVRFLNKIFSKLEIEVTYNNKNPQKTIENLLYDMLDEPNNKIKIEKSKTDIQKTHTH
jgi:ATP-dependent protease Clp ATPase subunit